MVVGLGRTGHLQRKAAKDLVPGDFVWCFQAASYRPTVTGHFRFIAIEKEPEVVEKQTYNCRWFNRQDGPNVQVPEDWILQTEAGPTGISERQQHSAFAHPGHLHDEIPLAVDLELFSNCFKSTLLTEAAAYFLGAFAARPECYPVGEDTWGVFGVRFNSTGAYGVSDSSRSQMRSWLCQHLEAVRQLATTVWGEDNFLVEVAGQKIGMEDCPVPSPHQPMDSRNSPVRFAIHAPIGRKLKLTTDGRPTSDDLRLIQYWYAFLRSQVSERATQSVRKALMLGAFDTKSAADKNRKTITLDFTEGVAGESPTYSALYAVGVKMLDSFERKETGHPRKSISEGRIRGRQQRCLIDEELKEIGFISDRLLTRAANCEPLVRDSQLSRFPAPSALSVCLGVPVQTIAFSGDAGSSERDLTQKSLFRTTSGGRQKFVRLEVPDQNLHAVSSLPLGWPSHPSTGTVTIKRSDRALLPLSRSDGVKDAIYHLDDLNSYLGTWDRSDARCPEPDEIFEYLIAVLMSQLDECAAAWVIARHEDQGVDVGADFFTGSDELGVLTVLIQAKRQIKPVARRVVDQLRGALHREQGLIGWVVTTSNFTAMAKKSAEKDYPTVKLVNGEALIKLLVRNRVGFLEEGRRRSTRVNMDISFFESLRELTYAAKGRSGQIFVGLSSDRMPEFRFT